MTFKHKLSKRLALMKAPLAAAAALAACEQIPASGPQVPSTAIVQVVTAPDTVTLDPYQTRQFLAYGRTQAGDSVAVAVRWTASGGTITSGGLYTADTIPGDYQVTATTTSQERATAASVQVTGGSQVKNRGPLTHVIVTPATASVLLGGTLQFAAYGRRKNGDSVAVSVVYAATGGTVSAGGMYTAGQSAGTYRVIATQSGGTLADTAAVTITTVPVASVAVSPATANVPVGGTTQLTATPKDANGNPLIGRVVTWASGAGAVATVNSGSGLVTGVAVGSATIRATSEGQTGTAAITVTSVPVASVTVSAASASVTVGGTVQLTATPKDATGNPLTGRVVTWASSAPTVATVTGTGLVSGLTAGLAAITATSEGQSGSAGVTVTAPSNSPITDPWAVLTEPTVSKLPALTPIFPGPFNLKVTRIVGDPGTTITFSGGGSGTWGSDARHHYSDDQPWNADGTLLMLQNSGSPSDLVLDGNTYQVISGGCSDGGYGRWHPSLTHAHERVKAYGTQLWWYDIRTCSTTRSWPLPFAATGDIEMGPSRDGRFIALSDGMRVFVVDMDPQSPFALYPNQRLGPVYDFSNCGVSSGCTLDWTQVSASGQYVIVHFEGDWQQVLDVNPSTLALTPRPVATVYAGCHGTAAQGFIYDLGHPDVTRNPFDANEDVIIGQEHCGNIGKTVNGILIGGVMMVRLRDGAITSLTNPTNEAYPYHISTRNLDRPGWVYVTYWPSSGQRFNDELVAVKLDGSGAVERYAHTHSDSNGCYRCEPHGVPARDGRRILWASNWILNATGGSSSVTQDYLVDAR